MINTGGKTPSYPVKMERDRTTENWNTASIFFSVQSGPCSDAVYTADRFITGVHYAVMQLSRLLYSRLPAPDSAFLYTQDVVNTFTHMASERFITHSPPVIFIHMSNSISSLGLSPYPGQWDGILPNVNLFLLPFLYYRSHISISIFY